MADLTPIAGWTAEDVQHLARRAGFGLSPEAAAALAAQPPQQAIAAWVDGAGADEALFDAVLADRADPVAVPAQQASGTPGSVDAPAVPGPHAYLVEGRDAWRDDLYRAQAYLAFRMQYAPHAFRERLALFLHNLFATGYHKVGSVALMLQQQATLRAHGLDRFDDLLVQVSKDPAMCIWLDSVLNDAAGGSVPNENYAREAMELYSLGADNGYSQVDITELARALSGWSFTVSAAQLVLDPTNPDRECPAGGTFRVYDGSPNPDARLWDLQAADALPDQHGTGTVSFLGRTFDVGAPPAGLAPGEDALRSIVGSRPAQCAQFLATRLLTHFVTTQFTPQDLADVAGLVQAQDFQLGAILKALLGSAYFFDPRHRFALVEGPVSWIVRAARALAPDLSTADAARPRAFPAWYLLTSAGEAGAFEDAGMRLLDPAGPNGWKEDAAWLNSNTLRYRTRMAAALALGETDAVDGVEYPLFPTDVASWFPAAPGSPAEVLARLVALLQPAPIPATTAGAWLSALWPGAFAWDPADPATQDRVRQLAYLVLCSPAGQLY